MQSRMAVTEVLRVVARQHTRLRGLVCEVAQTSDGERAAAAGWVSHYLVLHAAAERLGLSRESAALVHHAAAPRHGPLLGLALGLDLDESVICHRLALLEGAVVRHARAQERVVLPRLLATWPLADLHHAAAALEAADTVFDHGPSEFSQPSERSQLSGSFEASECFESSVTTDAAWHSAVADIERVLAAPAGGERQAARLREAMTTAAAVATTPTANVTTAVRRT